MNLTGQELHLLQGLFLLRPSNDLQSSHRSTKGMQEIFFIHSLFEMRYKRLTDLLFERPQTYKELKT